MCLSSLQSARGPQFEMLMMLHTLTATKTPWRSVGSWVPDQHAMHLPKCTLAILP